MNKLLTAGACTGTAVLLLACTAENKSPNIIFILADDMGYGDVSALNESSKIQTPNIDRLARRGAVFTDAHSSSSVSTPTRYGILTGRYNWRSALKSGVLNGYSLPLIPQERTTIASMLKSRDYETACIGKWHLGWRWNSVEAGSEQVDFSKPIADGPCAVGFGYFYGIPASLDMPPYVYIENDRPTAIPDRMTENAGAQSWWRKGLTAPDFNHRTTLSHLTDKAIAYIEEKAGNDNPFFLYLPLPAPHTPILPSDDFRGKSGLNPYGDFVMEVDYTVGRIIEAVRKNGIDRNTILVFTSDNGCSPEARLDELQKKGHYPSYIYRGHKADLFEGGHRIPCIVQWPARIRPHTVRQTICLTDFLATFASIAGYKLNDSEGEDSYNLLPLLENENENETSTTREATIHHSINGDFTIRQGDWKLLLSPGSGGWSYPRPDRDTVALRSLPGIQLYNLKTNPAETQNVYADHPETVTRMTSLLITCIENGRSTPGAPQTGNDGPADWKISLIMKLRQAGVL
ncbi:MAG: arylsulfatase [Tannerella sp.]|jgi:arylsulfatase A-like enzyme|nr:arylsulfatase [Tannerella sp.]